MKDNKQNLTDLIGALAVDIEEIKKKLDAKNSSDKDEALKRLEAKLEPIIQFFNGNTPKNVNAISEVRKPLKITRSHWVMKRLRACGYIPKPTRRICVSMEFPLSRSNSTRYWSC